MLCKAREDTRKVEYEVQRDRKGNAMTNLVGTTLGQYQIVELIGEGGMASVYKAWQPSLRRYVALKVLAPHLSSDVEFIKRFHQEAVSAANLQHTNIVTIHDVGTESGWHYIAMELIEGASLEGHIRSGQVFAMEQMVDVISQIGSALDYAHQRSFIHRDIKPANILIDASGRAVLTDFGIVKALSGSGLTAALTRAGTVFGTPEYMSPEQIKDEPLDHRSDLYALGIVCYEMLSGEAPFGGTTTHAIIYAQVNNPPPPLRHAGDLAVPAPVEAVVNKMLAKERTNRYYSAGEFARDLAQAVAGIMPAGISGETEVLGRPGTGTVVLPGTPPGMPVATVVQPAPTPMPLPVPAPARRSRWPLAVGAVAMVLILAAVAVIVVGGVNPLQSVQTALSLRSAQSALADGDYAAAVDEFSQVLESDPDNSEAIEGQLEAAASLAEAGDLNGAIEAYYAVWQVKPEDVRALQGLGRANEVKGEWGEAAKWYERWTQAATGDESAFLALGNARFNLEEHERAVAAYERADALGADAAEVDAHLGLAYYELAEYDQAIEHLQDAVSQDPDDFQLQRALGLAYYELAEYDQAVGHLQDAVSQESEDFQLQRVLGLSLYAQDQPEQAAEHLNKAVKLGAGRSGDELVDVHYALGGCYFEMQNYEQAITFYEQAQELDPEGEAVWAEGAQANLDEAYSELAQSVMEEALLDLDFSDIVTEGDETYAIAKTGQEVRIEGAVHLVDGPWEGSQALAVEEGTTNECKNPSVEIEAAFWSPASLGSVARTTDDARYGNASLRCSSGGDQSRVQGCYSGGVTTFSASIDYVVSGWYRLEDLPPGGNVSLRVHWKGGAHDNAATSVAVGTSKTGGWHRVSAVLTPDYNDRTDANFYLRIEEATGDGQSFLLDGFQIEQGQDYSTSYCDGAQGEDYSWSGTPHASTSTRALTYVQYQPSQVNLSSGAIAIWLKPGQFYNWPFIFGGHPPKFDSYLDMDGKVHFRIYDDESENGTRIAYVLGTGEANNWHHTVYIWSQSAIGGYNVWLYVDGVLRNQAANTYWPTSLPTNYTRLQAGTRRLVAEFIIFDRYLTAEEVAALYRVDVSASK